MLKAHETSYAIMSSLKKANKLYSVLFPFYFKFCKHDQTNKHRFSHFKHYFYGVSLRLILWTGYLPTRQLLLWMLSEKHRRYIIYCGRPSERYTCMFKLIEYILIAVIPKKCYLFFFFWFYKFVKDFRKNYLVLCSNQINKDLISPCAINYTCYFVTFVTF